MFELGEQFFVILGVRLSVEYQGDLGLVAFFCCLHYFLVVFVVVVVGLGFGNCEDLYVCGVGLVLHLHCFGLWLDFLLSSSFFWGLDLGLRYVLYFLGLCCFRLSKFDGELDLFKLLYFWGWKILFFV